MTTACVTPCGCPGVPVVFGVFGAEGPSKGQPFAVRGVTQPKKNKIKKREDGYLMRCKENSSVCVCRANQRACKLKGEKREKPYEKAERSRERKGSVFTVKFRGMLDTVRLRIVSLAVRGTGTARLLRPAFSAPPTARQSDGRTPSVVRTAGCRRREPKRDIFGWENRRRILKLYSIQLWQPA